MTTTTSPIISVDQLASLLASPHPMLCVVDVRWRLGQRGAGHALYLEGRIPGAVFLDVDADLSDIGDPSRGRHPLPAPARLSSRLAEVGVGVGTRVVAYDDAGGMHAARLWWLARWLGAEAVVLDGGLPAWIAAGHALETGDPPPPRPSASPLPAPPDGDWSAATVDKAAVLAVVNGATDALLLDARAPERYAGEVEPIDPRAGHIPGARNAPATVNVVAGRFRSPSSLRDQFEAAGVTPGRTVIAYCGSGVTACHDLLALELAGFPGAKLYPGSFSEWSNDPTTPIAVSPSDDGPS